MTVKQQRAQYDAENLECARIILSRPDKHPGLMQEWAHAVLMRLNQLPLIERKEAA